MFNQLTPADIVGAIGVTARDAARSPDGGSDFERDQLLSAYSATRHLAVELRSYGPVWEAFTAAAAEALRGAEETLPEVAEAARVLADEPDTATAGAALADLLADLRENGEPPAVALRTTLLGLVRGLADREVELLNEGLAA